ncbi:MAG: EAL domain-containing protein [Pseudomonadota bacterium]
MSSKDTIHILIVDDDEDDIFLICDTIDEIVGHKYEVKTAHSPAAAIDLLANHNFDLILSDYMLGSISGIEFIGQLRDSGIDTPVILLTGMGGGTIDQEALEAGASDFLSKSSLEAEILDRTIRYTIANTEKQRLLQTVLNNANAAVAVVNQDGKAILWNSNFTELVNWNAANNQEGATVADLISLVMACETLDILIGERIHDRRLANLPDGGTVITLHDVTGRVRALEERRAAEERIAYVALHDSLTGLPNRSDFSNRIVEQIERARADGHEFYLLNLDLNRFKEVNDVFGHHIGDGLLKEVADRLSGCLKSNEYLARLGGDEFVAIQPAGDEVDGLPSLAHRFLSCMDDTFEIEGKLVRTGLSIGAASFPKQGDNPEELLSNADVAMYRAKETPFAKVSVFDQAMDNNIREKRFLAMELKSAVQNEELEVFFQPQANVATGDLVGFEALARWHHPERGAVSPATFIPIAEENGLIIDLGEYILRRSCQIASKWSKDIHVAVNVSAVQIRHTDLISLTRSVLVDTGLSPSRLELEVTESVLIEDLEQTLHVLRGIKGMGVAIAMDDFGTGYSSLSSLLSFPFDKIKIDRSFIEHIGVNAQATEIVRAIIGMSNNMNFGIVAEGVQSDEHVNFLREHRCAIMQGYLLGPPMPAEKAELMIEGMSFEDIDAMNSPSAMARSA